ncbi:MAG: gliding motility-associated C-terminal domain-containing protein [Chitinophagales bacterium]|nr:gliding motility-associated C-terminal domain-containing protein [Chitinophagales bacterium]
MKKHYALVHATRVCLALTIFFFGLLNVHAQCPAPCAPNTYNEGTITPTSNAWQNINVGSGTYAFVNVHNGGTYSFSHCNTTNPNLTDLQISGTTGSACLFYNDDDGPFCTGLLSSAQWSSNYNGIINVNTNKYSCLGGGTTAATGGTFTITISSSAWLDETSWTLRNSSNTIIASGGPYTYGSTNTVNVTSSAVPLSFQIETQGSINDNIANYTITCGGNTILSGTITGGNNYTFPGLTCGSSSYTSYGSAILSYRCDGPGNPSVFGNGEWRLYAWNAGDASGGSGAWSSAYSGYMTIPTLSFNTTSYWTSAGSPSDYNGFLGCHVGVNNHSWSAKRTGFTCGTYNISVPYHDDAYQLFVNGVNVSQHTTGCCDNHGVVWTGVLDFTSTVEFRVSEGTGGSEAQLTVQLLNTPTLLGGTITANQTICSGGDPAAFTSSSLPSGGAGTYSYQWYSQANCSGGGTLISGATGTTYDPPSGLTTTTCYGRVVTDQCDNTAYSNVVTVTVNPDPSVNTPTYTNSTICIGGSTNVSVTASGGTGTIGYQWQYNNGGTWGNVANSTPAGATYSNQTTATMTVSGINTASTYQYRCIVSATGSGCDNAVSSAATLTVVADPTISSGPTLTNSTICVGGSTNASVTAANGTGTYGYQWQYNNGGTWINVSAGFPTGAAYANSTSATVTISGITATGSHQYRCIVTASGSGCDAVVSSTTTLTVNADPSVTAPAFTNSTICVGGSSGVSVTGSGGLVLSYQWQYNNSGTWGNVANSTPAGSTYTGAASASMTISGISAVGSYQYRCIVSSTGNDCNTTVSTVGTLTVVADPTVSAPSYTNSTICVGGSTNASVTASNGTGTYSYQWQYNNGGTWGNVANSTPAGATYNNQTTATMTVSGISTASTYQYRCIVSATGSGCDNAVSSAATLTVVADPSVTAPTLTNSTICVGGTSDASVTASGGTGTTGYQWQFNNSGTWVNVANGVPAGAAYFNTTSATMTISAITASGSYQYRAYVTATGSGCDPIASSAVTLTVNPDPSVSTPSFTNPTICPTGTTNVSVVGSGGITLSYQWQYNNSGVWGNVVNGTPAGATYTNATTANMTIAGITGLGSYQYRAYVTSTGSNCDPITSSAGTLVVTDAPSISIGTSITYCGSGSSTLTSSVSGGSGSPAYQWQDSPDNITFSNISGATSSSFTTPTLTTTTYYRCIYTTNSPGCNPGISNVVTITIVPAILNNTINDYQKFCLNGDPAIIVGTTPTGGTGTYTYAWQQSTNGGVSWSAATGTNNLKDYDPPFTSSTIRYRRIVTSSVCSSVSNEALILVLNLPQVTNVTSTNVLCFGGNSGTITVTGSTANGGIYYSNNGGSSYQVSGLFTGLTIGSYSIFVRDDSLCVNSYVGNPVVLTQPTDITHTTTFVDASCSNVFDGQITVNATGGVPNYQYSLNGGPTQSGNQFNGLAAGNYLISVFDQNGCVDTSSLTLVNTYAVTGSIVSQTNVSCFGGANGSVTVQLAGGIPPYQYSLNGGSFQASGTFASLPAGVYIIAARDLKGCTDYITVNITQPAQLIALVDIVNNVSCYGASTGEIFISVTGGTSPYTFNWSNGVTVEDNLNIPVGTYSVTVTDNKGCQTTTGATVTQPLPLTITLASSQNLKCFGDGSGKIDITVNGGISPYVYTWSNGAATEDLNNIQAGTYLLTVQDGNGCIKTAAYTITEPPQLTATITGTNATCNGSTNAVVDLTVTGGTLPYTYNWNTGATTEDLNGVPAGTYTVLVVDANSCTVFKSINITQPAQLGITTVVNNVPCNGGTGGVDLTVTGGTTPYIFNWSNGASTEDITNVASGTYTVTVTDANLCSATLSVTISQPAALGISGVVTDVNCNGAANGIVNITVTGGTIPFSFAWSNSAVSEDVNGLSGGTYSVTVTDANNCTISASYTVNEPPALTTSISGNNVTCFGAANGSITLGVNGGTSPYTFLWSNFQSTQNISGLTPGWYHVIVTDANSCTRKDSVLITQPTQVTISASVTNLVCNGGGTGAIDITVTGGVPGYSYLWSNGSSNEDQTNLSSGVYSVTVNDATLCSATASYTIIQPPLLTVGIASFNNVSCFGGSNGNVNVSITGGTPPYVYSWSNNSSSQNLSNVPANTYTLTVTDANNCTATVSQVITEPPLLTASAVAGTILCNGGVTNVDLTVGGGTPAYTYFWNSGAITEDLFGVTAGVYTVVVTDSKACTATASVTITQPAALTLSAQVTQPLCNGFTTGAINITAGGGTSPLTYLWSNTDTTEDLSGLTIGIYSVTVTDANGCSISGSYTISQPPALVVTLASANNVSCNGGSNGNVNIAVGGGVAPYSYSWSNGAVVEDLANVPADTYTVTVTDANGCTATLTHVVSEPPLLTASAVATGVILCYGGNTNVDLTVNGGTLPYTYFWNSGATTEDLFFVGAGVYTVVVTDAKGCTATASVSISQPPALVLTSQVSSPVCNGANTGTIDISVVGGVQPYTYNWSDGSTSEDLSGIPVGTYSVTVTDANGCTISGSYTITQPPALAISLASYNDVSCNGGTNGSVDITINGGTTPYTFAWSNNTSNEDLNNVSAGTYMLTVTDANSCTATASFVISEPPLLTASVSAGTIPCFGATTNVDLTIGGGTSGYSYFWNNGATTEDLTGVAGGIYTVLVTDANGCTATASVSINQPAQLALSTQVTHVLCNGASTGAVDLSVTGGTGSYSYSWSDGSSSEDLSGLTAGTYCVTVTDGNSCTATACVTITQPPAMIMNATTVNVACAGGNSGLIDITVGGGVFPYSYAWNNGATTEDVYGLSGNTYSVTVTDANGCTLTQTFIITEPTPLVTSITGTNVTCNGSSNGATDLTVSGGTPPYSFLWNTFQTVEDLSNISGGTYFVIVTDANGCTKHDSIVITEPPALVLSTQVTHVLCNGASTGAVDLSVTGGTGSYSYSWSDGSSSEDLSGLTAGTYCVTVTDGNSCTATACVTITQPAPVLITLASYNDVSCFGGNNGKIDISVYGGVPLYTFAWSNGSSGEDLNNVSAGTYTVTVTDANGCTATLSQTINEPTLLTATVTAGTLLCHGDTTSVDLTVTGGTTPYNYFWGTGAIVEDLYGVGAGTYSVIVTDANSCTATATIVIAQPTALVLSTQATHVLCNGASTGAIDLTVTGGTLNYSFNWGNGASTEDLTGITAGTYCVTVTDGNGCTATACVTITQPTPLAMFGIVQNVSCNGGSNGAVNITVSGGVQPYTYMWSNGYQFEDVTGLPQGTHSVTVTDANGCTLSQSFIITEPSPIVSSTTHVDVTCHGAYNGSIDLTVSGGVAPYTFFWSTFQPWEDISGLGGGTYYVSITDANGCVKYDSAVVYEPAPLILTTTSSNISCFNANNGSIDLTVTGGTQPYTYAWNHGPTVEDPTNLPGGTYSVIVTDANGCTATTSVFIVNPSAISVNFIVQSPLCFGDLNGSINLIPTGGTPGYTFAWNNGPTTEDITGVPAGVYTVTVTDANGCTASDSTTIVEPAPLLTSGVIQNVTCAGDCDGYVVITAYGGTLPYNYLWSNGPSTKDIYSVCGGNYYVSVTDGNGCQVASLYIVKEPTPLTVSLTGTNILCYGASTGTVAAIPGGGTLPYEYLWDDFTNDSIRFGLTAGRYGLLLSDSNGCKVIDSIWLTQPTEITINGNVTDVQCFNGTNGAIDINVTGGTPGYTYAWSSGSTNEDLANIPKGNYTVGVSDVNGCLKSRTFTVTQPMEISLQMLTVQPSCFGSKNGSVSVVATQGVGPYTYNWNTTPPQTTATAIKLFAGTYEVTVTDASNCTVSASALLTQPSEIEISTDATASKCFNTPTGQVVISVVGGDPPYIYELNGIAQASDTFKGLSASNYVVVVTDVNGCEASTTFTIASPSQISVDLSVSQQVILTGMQTTLIAAANSSQPIVNYIWSPDSLVSFVDCSDPANCATPYAVPKTTTMYTVWVMNSDSCFASDTVTVIVKNEISAFIPTVFTPNGDGLNDYFNFDILGAENVEVSVFDRWGQRVYYNASQPNGIFNGNGWDGNLNGKYAPDDTYVYQFTIKYFDGTVKEVTGTISVMR